MPDFLNCCLPPIDARSQVTRSLKLCRRGLLLRCMGLLQGCRPRGRAHVITWAGA